MSRVKSYHPIRRGHEDRARLGLMSLTRIDVFKLAGATGVCSGLAWGLMSVLHPERIMDGVHREILVVRIKYILVSYLLPTLLVDNSANYGPGRQTNLFRITGL